MRRAPHGGDATRRLRFGDLNHAIGCERGLKIAAWYTENESGAKLARPELFRLLNDSQPGDILLTEQVDRAESSEGRRLAEAPRRAGDATG